MIFQVLLFSQEIKNNKLSNNNSSLLEKSLTQGESFRAYLSERLIYFSTNIDNYLSNKPDDKIYDNPTYIHIEQSFEKKQGQSIGAVTNFRLRLKLPKLKEKYKIEIWNKKETNDESNDLRIDDPKNDQGVNAGISYVDKIKEYLNFSSGLGVKLKLDEFEPFAKASISKQIDYKNDWIVDLSERIFLSDKNGFDTTSSFEIHKIFNDVYKFSSYNEYYWNKKIKDDNFYNSLRLNQTLSKKRYLSYVLSAASSNSDSTLEVKNYQAYVSYRHYIKKWLYYDVIPRYSWERVNDFDPDYGIQINFGMFFGKK
ncbi:hypothetical protein A9Q76_03785 [Arcobacter sp. 31_11_sub10_T18]|nr:hypothetical protein A9Q76_03785 [Arcobacter sp. 31_11_sub10_T18]